MLHKPTNCFDRDSVLSRVFLGIPIYISTVYYNGAEGPQSSLESCQKNVSNLENLDSLKMNLPALSKVFLETLSKEFWTQYLAAHTNSTILEYFWVRHWFDWKFGDNELAYLDHFVIPVLLCNKFVSFCNNATRPTL